MKAEGSTKPSGSLGQRRIAGFTPFFLTKLKQIALSKNPTAFAGEWESRF